MPSLRFQKLQIGGEQARDHYALSAIEFSTTGYMKKVIYFLCCLLSILVLGYMIYEAWTELSNNWQSHSAISRGLGALGWLLITYNIVTQSYGWTKKLCK